MRNLNGQGRKIKLTDRATRRKVWYMADNRTVTASGLWTRIIDGALVKLSVINSFYLCKTSHHFPITNTGLADCRLAAKVWRDYRTKAEGEHCEYCKAGYIVTFSKRKVIPDEPISTNATQPVCESSHI